MQEEDILNRLESNDKKLDDIFKSVERTRKYIMWTLIISVVVVVLPLLGLSFVIPQYLKTLTGTGLGF